MIPLSIYGELVKRQYGKKKLEAFAEISATVATFQTVIDRWLARDCSEFFVSV